MSNTFKFAALASVCLFAVSCASSEPAKKTAAEETEHYQPVHQLVAGKTIVSDHKNANYDKNETTTTVAKVPVMPELKEDAKPATAVKAKEPVKKLNETVTKSKKKNIPVIRQQAPKAAPSVNYQIGNILFADGGAEVSSSYNAEIAKIARLAKKHNALIRVYGFSSSRTKDTDIVTHKTINFKISLQRAENVAKALRRAGVKKENIVIEALSDSRPLFSEAMPEGERLNRRAEIYISY